MLPCSVALAAGRRSNRKKKEVVAIETDAVVEATEEGAVVKATKKKRRAVAVSKVPVFGMPHSPSPQPCVTPLPSAPPASLPALLLVLLQPLS